MDRAQRGDEKWRHSSSYVYSQSYGQQNTRNDLFFVFSTEYRKKSIPVWTKYLSASERSYLSLSENTMEN